MLIKIYCALPSSNAEVEKVFYDEQNQNSPKK